MDTRAEPAADDAKPRNSGVGGLCHLPLNVEMKYGLRAAGTFLGQSSPAWVARARRAVAQVRSRTT
jgi:hypothetical protein